MSGITVLSVAPEIYPLIKTGGLADVTGALAGALAAEGIAVVTLVPGYPAVTNKINAAEPVLTIPNLFGGDARVLRATAAGLDLFVLDAPHLFARPGGGTGRARLAGQPIPLRGALPNRRTPRAWRISAIQARRRACARLAGGVDRRLSRL
jgi:glycogen synthase